MLSETGSARVVHCLHGKVEVPGYTGPEFHPEQSVLLVCKVDRDGDLLGGPVAKTPQSQYRGPGFDPCSCKTQQRSKILHATTKTQCSQINIKKKKR